MSGGCPICGAPSGEKWAIAQDWEYRTSDQSFTYYRCRACLVLFLDPLPSDRLAEIYPPNYYSFDASAGKSLVGRVKDWIDRRMLASIARGLAGRELRVLDIGGGAGWQLGSLRQAEPRVRHTQIVDIDPSAGERARAQGHGYFCGTAEEFETNERFDMILLLNLIEHVASPRAVLGKLRTLLAPGGRILVKTPNYDALDARLFRHRHWAGYHCPRHWTLFTRENFSVLAEETGFSVRGFRYTQGAPFWAASVLACLARRRLAAITPERPVVQHPLFPLLSAVFAVFDFVRRPWAKTSQMIFVLEAKSGARRPA